VTPALAAFLVVLALQRGAELLLAARNERRMRARGGIEHAAGHFPLIVLVHLLFPLALVVEVIVGGVRPPAAWPVWLVAWLAAQGLRYAAVAALGDRWSVRIWTVPGEPPVRRGPYRFLRHPNYVAVALELAAAPLMFGAWRTALAITALNAIALAIRIRAEERALATASRGAERVGAGWEAAVAVLAAAGIALHLVLRFGWTVPGGLAGWPWAEVPLLAVLVVGGLPLTGRLLLRMARRQLNADLLAGISIVTAVLLGENLAGAIVVLMLSGGQALESFAVRRASSALDALARRMPSVAHVRRGPDAAGLADVPLEEIRPGDLLVVFPHETCPADGVVVDGRSTMNEAYLTGEPYLLPKAAGSAVLSGAINGEGALTIRAERTGVDSRYAKIMQVMRDSEQRRPRLRRLGDRLGAVYAPFALAIAGVAWAASGDPLRFLAVLVVATPCPLLIAIPVAIIGSVSLAARRGIIVRDPAALERIDTCRTAIFDKTGTLTYGEARLTGVEPVAGFAREDVLAAVASLERYSRHPLAAPILAAARQAGVPLDEAREVSERPGEGLRGTIDGRRIEVTGRGALARRAPDAAAVFPPESGGLECVVLIDERPAALLRFRDEPRAEGRSFVRHLGPRHGFDRVLLVSGDRESEVRYLAEQVGIDEVHAGQSPEQKLVLVRGETARAPTVFLGDGINDAPAMTAATVGIAFGQASDVTSEAAGVVILDSSLGRVDELLHIGRNMRAIALQSAIGGMALSLLGMLFAAAGHLPPVAGAVTQELIDVAAIVNALRVVFPPRVLSDY
jgi:heavy metal translocating P-type ATPase